MIDPLAPVGGGHTPVSDDVLHELIPTYIATLDELNEAESENIATRTFGLHPPPETLLDDLYLRDLHRRMFDQVWRWAGQYRQHDVSIVITRWQELPVLVRDVVEDAKVWMAQQTFDVDELVLRFHHRLVEIHPFVNGNGRHGRFAADLLAQGLGQPPFTWGAGLDVSRQDLRARYQLALQRMDSDRDDVAALVTFARS